MIWWSYIHLSKRVKNTFVEDDYRVAKWWAIFIIILIWLWLFWLFSQVDYKKLTKWNLDISYEKEEIIEWKQLSDIINISDYYQININKNNLTLLPNIKSINVDASMWFKSKNWTYTLIIPEELDYETKELFSTTYDDDLLEQLEKMFESDFWINISSSNSTKRRWDKFFEFSWYTNIDWTNVYYNIWYTLNWTSLLNIYPIYPIFFKKDIFFNNITESQTNITI